ncbi:aldehyde reductase [Phyllobacterium salinisoli]|uniref:Aldehyde reductase n=1 Tax=Phyllobacterium salinisoli TaxID=1899321 RepID=A0A368K0Y7_9HYPH|nr:aldehyde reductase [Phyllobacterium salinisoli]RCS22834.1 aldehyde reductase [Phyllobacterium salinisoli]
MIEKVSPQNALVLVTGVSGFLGGHVALQLLQQGYRVRGTIRRMASATTRIPRFQPFTENLSLVEADLNYDQGWTEAVSGCDYVIHTASPFPSGAVRDEAGLIRTARDGTLRVLRAAHQGRVQRVVLTSSIAATNHGSGRAPFSERDWTDVGSKRATPYYKSKTLAERAAWAFANEHGLSLSVVNPGPILGPLMGYELDSSVGLVWKLMNGKFSRLPRYGCSIVDVRDVAIAHVRAMVEPQAAGHRFIVGGRVFSMKDLSHTLARCFPEYKSSLPTAELPDWFVRILALVDADAQSIVHELGRDLRVDTSKAAAMLQWHPRPEEETIRDCGRSLIDRGLVPLRTATRSL